MAAIFILLWCHCRIEHDFVDLAIDIKIEHRFIILLFQIHSSGEQGSRLLQILPSDLVLVNRSCSVVDPFDLCLGDDEWPFGFLRAE